MRCYRVSANIPALPSLFGLAPGVVCHAGSVAGSAVRSYRTFSPLLPPPFWGWGNRFVLCGTVPGVAPAGRYPAPYVDGARTFLSSHLSVIAGAAVRPTDALGMEVQARRVKPIRRAVTVKINYSENVVLPLPRSTGCRRNQPIKRSYRNAVFVDDLSERSRARQNGRNGASEDDGGIRCIHPVHHSERPFQGRRWTATDNDRDD